MRGAHYASCRSTAFISGAKDARTVAIKTISYYGSKKDKTNFAQSRDVLTNAQKSKAARLRRLRLFHNFRIDKLIQI